MPSLKHRKKTPSAPKKKAQKKAPVKRLKRRVAPRVTKAARRAALLKAIREARTLRERREPIYEQPLRRHEDNPILSPREHNYWEMKATFNPGAVYADKRVHLLYRAIGGDDMSVLGYAASDDGVTITERLSEPAYIPKTDKKTEAIRGTAPPVAYLSGGGWNGGCEDPRLTLIDDRIYLTYTAFDGWGSIRIALSSINVEDFLRKEWNWKNPALISPPGEIHKNWMLLPEKINGKFALLHSISPKIRVDYFDSLSELESGKRFVESNRTIVSHPERWDSFVRGAGPPPMKTRLGWLLFYHAIDARDPGRYKLGAMILDENDPEKILYRSRQPILEPEAHYENNGLKSGVVYSCGAIVKGGELYVYYGGSDSVTCVAMADLDQFLEDLKRYGVPRLQTEGKIKTK
jgi:beta-1,2-mannobiose phosphorylase / 1,2-beta-oligomannan phosphorylase